MSELVWVEVAPGRHVLRRTDAPEPELKVGTSAWRKHKNRALSIPHDQASPERIAKENEQAKLHGGGVHFDKDGFCHIESRAAFKRELQRQQRVDLASYY